jgi:hypothetical protein
MNNFEKDVADSEIHGLITQSLKLRKDYRQWTLPMCLLGVSISLNVILVVSGFIYWVCFWQLTRHSYENGFASDISMF